jgi:hypothetical protein
MESQMLLGSFDIKYKILTLKGIMLSYWDRLHGTTMRRTMVPTLWMLIAWDLFPMVSFISSPSNMYFVSCNWVFHELGWRGGVQGEIILFNHHIDIIRGLRCKWDKNHCHDFLSIEHCFVKPKIFPKAWSVQDDKNWAPYSYRINWMYEKVVEIDHGLLLYNRLFCRCRRSI